jgi:hypothetical protein
MFIMSMMLALPLSSVRPQMEISLPICVNERTLMQLPKLMLSKMLALLPILSEPKHEKPLPNRAKLRTEQLEANCAKPKALYASPSFTLLLTDKPLPKFT